MRLVARGAVGAACAGFLPVRVAAVELPVSGAPRPQLVDLDRLMTAFLQEYDAPGSAVAVTKDSRLVYARGFGYADPVQKERVEPTSLFRIGSISKTITAVAMLQLVERGQLGLESKVLDILPHRPFLQPGAQADARLKRITVLHLLQHTGGWDHTNQETRDPVSQSGCLEIAQAFGVQSGNPSIDQMVSYTLGKQLNFDPGQRHSYCNFGYLLLGLVLEAMTGQRYRDYVLGEVLRPLGIQNMQVTRGLRGERAAGEVTYHDHQRDPYTGYPFDPIGAVGRWIAPAIALVRFAAAFDDPQRCPLLKPESVRQMFSRPRGLPGFEANGKPKSNYYACGWKVAVDRRGAMLALHGGRLPGGSSQVCRKSDGVNYAVLFNTSGRTRQDQTPLADRFGPKVREVLDSVRRWPEAEPFRGT